MVDLNNEDLRKISGGNNDMVISETCINDEDPILGATVATVVKYKCPNCGNEFESTYRGAYATAKGYPATQCPNCGRKYWGGEEVR